MISKEKVRELILSGIEDKDILLVDIQISTSNQIKILLDSQNGVSIKECVQISRLVENDLDREKEDFELEVSSYGLMQPFILPLHFLKNIDRKVEVYLKDGGLLIGILSKVELTENKMDVKQIEISRKKKVKLEGKKRKVEIEEKIEIKTDEIQKAKLVLTF